MYIGILTIGDELTSGRIQNTNATWIASQLQRQGWNIASMLSVGDTEESIGRAIDYFPDHCRAVVITGGLGPTPDDITAKAVAKACGRPLIKNDRVLASIQDRVEACGFRWREALERQALFPEGADVIPNPVGSTWGFSLIHRGCLFIVLPGVPAEATRMVTDHVIPLLRRIDPEPPSAIASRTLKCFGITESDVAEKIQALTLADGSVQVGFYPQFPEVHLVLTARHRLEDNARKNLFVVEEAIAEALKPYLFGRD